MSINLTVPNNSGTPELKPRITVIGVGGAGGNAVNNMIQRELGGVDFVVTNTDSQALSQSKADRRIQLGAHLTQGLGAGAKPEIGRAAAEEAVDAVLAELENSHMAFIAAGMGGGTGTGAAPVIARAARDAGILTVGVVTKPFQFEGSHRMKLADQGIEELEQYVDTLIVIPNQNLFRIATESTTFSDAFAKADQVLYSGVRGVTDLIVMPGLINLDFADIRSVMSEMGKAMMGTGEAEGDRRALDAAEAAIANPLLEDTSMKGARGVLINITGSDDIKLFEVDEAANRIRAEVDEDARIIVGSAFDPSLEGVMRVSVVATGINADASRAPAPITLSIPDETRPHFVKTPPEWTPATSHGTAAEEEPEASASLVVRGLPVTDDAAVADIVEEQSATGKQSPLELLLQAQDEEAADQLVEKKTLAVSFPPADSADRHEPAADLAAKPPSVGAEQPVDPPLAVPTMGATDAFIPPRPVVPGNHRDTVKPDPFRAADMTNGSGGHQEDQNRNAELRRPSLFERVTRSGRAAISRVGGASSDGTENPEAVQQKMDMPVSPMFGSAPPPLMRAENAQHNLAEAVPSEMDEAEADKMDIPAFLRRQAN